MKKILYLLIFVICAAMPLCVAAEDTGDVEFVISTTVKGDAVTVTVDYSGAGVCGGNLDLMYVPEITAFAEFAAGDAITDVMHFVNEKYADNCIRLNWASVTPLPDSGNMATFSFDLVDEAIGDEDISLYSLKINDENGERLSTSVKYVFNTDKPVSKPSSGSSGGSSGAPARPSSGSGVVVVENQQSAASAMAFSDVSEQDWFYDAVKYVYEQGLMNGLGDGIFAPEQPVTRAMVVTVLYRIENSPMVESASPFEDVPDGSWYANAVIWANQNGIVNGVSDTSFAPDASITREQTATMLYRYAGYKQADTLVPDANHLLVYDDFGSISGYAIEAMAWINSKEIMTGISVNELSPGGVSTRGQIATVLKRFLEMN